LSVETERKVGEAIGGRSLAKRGPGTDRRASAQAAGFDSRLTRPKMTYSLLHTIMEAGS
jgi:hypothetical protein